MCFYFTECLYLNAYFDYSTAKYTNIMFPIEGIAEENCNLLSMEEAEGEGRRLF